MYKVTYYFDNTNQVKFKSFDTLFEATLFSNKQPINSVIEIKHYEDSTNNGPTLWR
jgi:hypothetical protein